MSSHHGGSHGPGDGHYFLSGGHRYSTRDYFRPHYTLTQPSETRITVVQQSAPAFPIETGTVIGIVGAVGLGAVILYLATRK